MKLKTLLLSSAIFLSPFDISSQESKNLPFEFTSSYTLLAEKEGYRLEIEREALVKEYKMLLSTLRTYFKDSRLQRVVIRKENKPIYLQNGKFTPTDILEGRLDRENGKIKATIYLMDKIIQKETREIHSWTEDSPNYFSYRRIK